MQNIKLINLLGDGIKQIEDLINEEVAIYREEFKAGIVNVEIHKGVLLKEGEQFFLLNKNGRIALREGDRIMYKGWEKIFRI